MRTAELLSVAVAEICSASCLLVLTLHHGHTMPLGLYTVQLHAIWIMVKIVATEPCQPTASKWTHDQGTCPGDACRRPIPCGKQQLILVRSLAANNRSTLRTFNLQSDYLFHPVFLLFISNIYFATCENYTVVIHDGLTATVFLYSTAQLFWGFDRPVKYIIL